MRLRGGAGARCATLALLGVLVTGAALAAPADPVTAALAKRLRTRGRAVARIERTGADPLTGGMRRVAGRLALEWPDRAALEFTGTGERLTMRSDGGEWLQPGLHQLVKFSAADAAGVTRWWQLLLRSGPGAFTAVPAGAHRWVVTAAARDGLPEDRATIVLGTDGLPRSLEVEDAPGTTAHYRFDGWTFSRPRGPAAFVLAAPPGFEIVPLH